jgi:signal transduction histidine kinase
LSSSAKGLIPGSASELLVQRAAAPAPAPQREAQSLLSAAVERLRERTRCEIAVAWTLSPDGAPFVAAASTESRAPLAPSPGEFEAAIRLPRPCALLGSDASPMLRGIAARHGLAAAAPVAGAEGPALAVLLIGGTSRAEARPRELATLTAAARRLALPLAAAEAERQLARLDSDVRRLDRLAALGRMAQELAHEVRNPLVSVKTFLQLLPERRDDPEFTTRFLGVAGQELERTLRLLALVIDYPAAEAAAAEPASVLAAVEAVLELLRPYARQRGVSLASEARASDARSEPKANAVHSDWPQASEVHQAMVGMGGDALRQVLLNLLLNAIDATPRGGAVTVTTSAQSSGVELVVSDAGAGVAPELRERVFEPFFTTRGVHHGGIGLAIARGLVEQAGGRIRVRAAEGGGAAFVVSLPAG